ncbi:unnamed protein product [Rotaria magnacalcarata]|uniref:Uncharacterized protein n=1 Tax=Rotaria magnacalcarata TaxID=392030 RepID=A0A816MJR0_9BILA|nr:unnamed protein product [Rotaria magnacalcarata]CAF1984420.1 unnamed protein product [Rotaria magnacalcarata]
MREAHRKITPVIPSSVIFDIPEWYQQTFSSERFLLVDFFMTHGKDRVLVCSSDQHLELLFESETIFMDGAFDTTPTNFKQFSMAVLYGCMFHLNQTIHRIITDLDLANDYLHNGSIRDRCH